MQIAPCVSLKGSRLAAASCSIGLASIERTSQGTEKHCPSISVAFSAMAISATTSYCTLATLSSYLTTRMSKHSSSADPRQAHPEEELYHSSKASSTSCKFLPPLG